MRCGRPGVERWPRRRPAGCPARRARKGFKGEASTRSACPPGPRVGSYSTDRLPLGPDCNEGVLPHSPSWPPSWARSPSTRGRCAVAASNWPGMSCGSTSTHSRHGLQRLGRRTRAAHARARLGWVGFPKTSGGRGVHVYVRIERLWSFTDVRHAAIAIGRELERRSEEYGARHDPVVEGGAGRGGVWCRLQPERSGPDDPQRLVPRGPRGDGVGARDLGRVPRGRAG